MIYELEWIRMEMNWITFGNELKWNEFWIRMNYNELYYVWEWIKMEMKMIYESKRIRMEMNSELEWIIMNCIMFENEIKWKWKWFMNQTKLE